MVLPISLVTIVLAATAVATQPPPEPAQRLASLDGVDAISIEGVGHARVTIGPEAELRYSGPAATIEQYDIAIDDDELEIETLADAGAGELHLEISVERLRDLRVRGAFVLELVELAGDELDVRLRGAASVVATGTVDELEVDARDTATFDGAELAAGAAEVEAGDSARLVVNVSGDLEAHATGSAIVEHVGAPAALDVDVSQSADVRTATGSLLAPPASTSLPPPGSAPPPAADSGPAAGPAVHEVSLAGRAFTPAVLEVAAGDTVTWVNDDDADHTVSATDGAFDSGALAEGASFTFTFDTPGEYRYICFFHEEMQGTIIVT